MQTLDRLWTPDEAAAFLQISRRTVYDMANRGTIPAIKVGGQMRFRCQALDDWIAESGWFDGKRA